MKHEALQLLKKKEKTENIIKVHYKSAQPSSMLSHPSTYVLTNLLFDFGSAEGQGNPEEEAEGCEEHRSEQTQEASVFLPPFQVRRLPHISEFHK